MLSGSIAAAVIGLCLMGMTVAINAGPTNAVISELAPPRKRGLAFAIYAVIANVVGAGLGPLAVGAMSDAFGGTQDALRAGMMVALFAQVLAILTYLRAASTFRRAVEENASISA